MNIENPGFAAAADEHVQVVRAQGWHSIGGHDDLAVVIDESETGDAEAFDVGVDLGPAQRYRKAERLGPGGEQSTQIGALGGFFGGLIDVALGERQQRGHVELERGVVGELAHVRALAVEPIIDSADTAVGDDAHAHLPRMHVALALRGDELQHPQNADPGDRRQGNRGQDHHAQTADSPTLRG